MSSRASSRRQLFPAPVNAFRHVLRALATGFSISFFLMASIVMLRRPVAPPQDVLRAAQHQHRHASSEHEQSIQHLLPPLMRRQQFSVVDAVVPSTSASVAGTQSVAPSSRHSSGSAQAPIQPSSGVDSPNPAHAAVAGLKEWSAGGEAPAKSPPLAVAHQNKATPKPSAAPKATVAMHPHAVWQDWPWPGANTSGQQRNRKTPYSKQHWLHPDLAARYKAKFGDKKVFITTGSMRNFLVPRVGASRCDHTGSCDVNCDVPCHIQEQGSVSSTSDCQIFGYCGGGFQYRADPHAYNKPKTQSWAIFQAEKASHCPGDVGNARFMSKYDWIMSFHANADVFMPPWEGHLGFTVESPERILKPPDPQQYKAEALVLFVQGSCNTPNKREDYIRDLMKHVSVHATASCLHNHDPGPEFQFREGMSLAEKYNRKVKLASRYRFTIAFENAYEKDWHTEKFWHAVIANSIPVYMGALNIDEFLPAPKSAILARDFASAEELGRHLKYLAEHEQEYLSYFKWKQDPGAIAKVKAMFAPRRPRIVCQLCRLVAQHKLQDGSIPFGARVITARDGIQCVDSCPVPPDVEQSK